MLTGQPIVDNPSLKLSSKVTLVWIKLTIHHNTSRALVEAHACDLSTGGKDRKILGACASQSACHMGKHTFKQYVYPIYISKLKIR